MVQPIPEGFNTASAYLVVPDSRAAIEFYGRAFGAEGSVCMPGPGGHGTLHAEMRLGSSTVMLTDVNPQWGKQGPKELGGSPVSIHLYVEDADAVFAQAVAAGCEVKAPLMDMFWGDRFGAVEDPFGHGWSIATRKEDLSPAEMEQRQQAWFEQMAQSGGA